MDVVDRVGFGTYPLEGDVCAHAVKQAVELGYHIFDTATFYNNFEAIARGLNGVDRSQVYLISKVWHDQQAPLEMREDLMSALKELRTNYLDAYLLHWPNSRIPIEETLAAMEEFRREKKIHHIGLSNVTVNHLKRVLEVGVPITWVQVEMHPFFYDKALLEFCHAHAIGVQAWRPLDLGRISQDELLRDIGQKIGKTACQIALRWIVQYGCVPLPGSKSKTHMAENLAITDFALTQEDMHKINRRAAAGQRFRLTEEIGFGFTDEFDFSYEQCWPKNLY